MSCAGPLACLAWLVQCAAELPRAGPLASTQRELEGVGGRGGIDGN